MHQPHSQRPDTCSKARLQGLRLFGPVLFGLAFGGWLLKEESAAACREYSWLNHALFGERTTGFWLQTRHVCVSASSLALTIRGYTWLSASLSWKRVGVAAIVQVEFHVRVLRDAPAALSTTTQVL